VGADNYFLAILANRGSVVKETDSEMTSERQFYSLLLLDRDFITCSTSLGRRLFQFTFF